MRRALFCLALLGLAAPRVAAGQLPDHPLTLRETLELLRARNPLLWAARSRADAVAANEITAGLRPNPVFTSANEDFNVFKPSEFDIRRKQEFTDSVLQIIERGHKRQLRVESARLGTRVAEDTYRDTERQLELAVKSSFVGLLLAKSNLQLAQDNLRDYQETVRLNEIRLKAGEISPTELDRIRLEQARFENDVLAAQLAVDQARVQLEGLLGLEDFPPTFDIQGELTAPELALTARELAQKALAARPDYLAAVDGTRKAEADVRLADANGATDISVGSEYKRNGPDNTIGFTVAFPLRLFDRNQGEKLRTRRESDASRSAELAARIAVLADVALAYEAYRSALARAQLYSRDYIARARQVRDHVAFSYRHGASSLLDYLDAVRSYRDVELAWRSSHAQVMTSIHQLSFVTATELWP
jgi:cobalt-zinc-cadmium efflux system outer membrane protein